MSEVKPALTPEEWAQWLDPKAPVMFAMSDHACAATDLYGQPFGFTWEDVDAIRDAADELHWSDEATDRLYSLVQRLSSLLPPREET